MPYNASGQSFATLAVVPVLTTTVIEGAGFNGLTTAQCAANGNLTSKAVTSAGVLVEAGKVRTNGMTVIVPTDQPQVTFGNQSPLTGTTAKQPIVAIPAVTSTDNNNNSPPSSGGFAITPGSSVQVTPFNDPMYAITPTGVSATVYFFDN